jgi:cell division protein FtsN
VAAQRGKSQARRNGGRSQGLPGWAWLVLGVALTVVVVLAAPRLLKSGAGDGFFRPHPNPDAQPAPVRDGDDAVADDGDAASPTAAAAHAPAKPTRYDFYTLLPGNEVVMSDAELAATAREEAARQAHAGAPASIDAQAPDGAANTATAAPSVAPAPVAAETSPQTPYLLQAGAFGASADAEAIKAKVALLGLSARVESATIGDKTVYRVRMGPYATASDLSEAKRKLASGGLPAMAIRVK